MKVIVTRTDRLGDVILSLPVAKVIKELGSKVIFMVSEYTAPLITGHPDIDAILKVKVRGRNRGEIKGLLSTVKKIRDFSPDCAVILYPRISVALALLLGRVKMRIGTSTRPYSFLFSKRVKVERKKGKKHEAEYNLELLKPLGVAFSLSPPKLYITDEERSWGEEKLSILLGKRPRVLIHPFSAGSSENLSFTEYMKIAKMLPASVGIIGARNVTMEGIEGVKNLAGIFSLRELMAIIASADLLISGNTGPVHISSALGTPTFGIYPQKSITRWRPLGRAKVLPLGLPPERYAKEAQGMLYGS